MEMLEHQKLVLTHVSNDENLFKRELLKSFKWLNSTEQLQLTKWLMQNFKEKYDAICTGSI